MHSRHEHPTPALESRVSACRVSAWGEGERDNGDTRVGDVCETLYHRPTNRPEHLLDLGAGKGEHYAVGVDLALRRRQHELGALPGGSEDRAAQPHVAAGFSELGLERRQEAPEATGEPEEGRLGRERSCALTPRSPGRAHPRTRHGGGERAHDVMVPDERPCDLRRHGPKGQLVKTPGVDPADQWICQPVDDLVTEALAEEVAGR